MRNLFKISALPIFVLALSLGGIACGDDKDAKDSDNVGGSGGTENPGGTGGTDTTPPTARELMCDHWYSNGCTGFAQRADANSNPVPVSREECPSKVGLQWTAEQVACMTEAACSQEGINSCIPPPKPPEPTQECDDLCDHVYSEECDLFFQTANGEKVTSIVCKQQCPATPWSGEKAITDCLTTFDCSEGTTLEQRQKALEACFPAE